MLQQVSIYFSAGALLRDQCHRDTRTCLNLNFEELILHKVSLQRLMSAFDVVRLPRMQREYPYDNDQ